MTVGETLAARWKDAANLGLGLWLVISPWALGYVDETTATRNAWIVGAIIAVAALAALVAFQKWEEWVNAALAIWLIAAPYALGFTAHTSATWNHVVVGVAVAVLAVWAAMEETDTGPLTT